MKYDILYNASWISNHLASPTVSNLFVRRLFQSILFRSTIKTLSQSTDENPALQNWGDTSFVEETDSSLFLTALVSQWTLWREYSNTGKSLSASRR